MTYFDRVRLLASLNLRSEQLTGGKVFVLVDVVGHNETQVEVFLENRVWVDDKLARAVSAPERSRQHTYKHHHTAHSHETPKPTPLSRITPISGQYYLPINADGKVNAIQ